MQLFRLPRISDPAEIVPVYVEDLGEAAPQLFDARYHLPDVTVFVVYRQVGAGHCDMVARGKSDALKLRAYDLDIDSWLNNPDRMT